MIWFWVYSVDGLTKCTPRCFASWEATNYKNLRLWIWFIFFIRGLCFYLFITFLCSHLTDDSWPRMTFFALCIGFLTLTWLVHLDINEELCHCIGICLLRLSACLVDIYFLKAGNLKRTWSFPHTPTFSCYITSCMKGKKTWILEILWIYGYFPGFCLWRITALAVLAFVFSWHYINPILTLINVLLFQIQPFRHFGASP